MDYNDFDNQMGNHPQQETHLYCDEVSQPLFYVKTKSSNKYQPTLNQHCFPFESSNPLPFFKQTSETVPNSPSLPFKFCPQNLGGNTSLKRKLTLKKVKLDDYESSAQSLKNTLRNDVMKFDLNDESKMIIYLNEAYSNQRNHEKQPYQPKEPLFQQDILLEDSQKYCKLCNFKYNFPNQLGGHMSKVHPGSSPSFTLKMKTRQNRTIARANNSVRNNYIQCQYYSFLRDDIL